MAMNHRERARLILNHCEADRPAIDLGSTIVGGTSAWTYRALKGALGRPCERVRVGEMFQMLAEVETDVLDALGADFAMLPKEERLLGLAYGQWRPYTFWDGQTFDVPANFAPQVTPEGALEIASAPGGPLTHRLPKGGWFFDLIPGERQDSFEIPHIPESEWTFTESLTDEFLSREEERAHALYQATDRALVAWSPVLVPLGYGGLYQWAMKMATEPEHCRAYMVRAGEAAARCIGQYLQAVGDYIDVIIVNLADFGAQDREMFRPALFHEFFVPSWKLVTDAVHHFPRVKTFSHCCGSVPHLIADFIAAGIDCLNPVQWTAAGMDLRWLKQTYGDKLVFWGGAISTQRTFPHGTPEEVVREAREVLEVLAPGGGFVVNPIHNVLPEVPVENVLALYRTAQEYRYAAQRA